MGPGGNHLDALTAEYRSAIYYHTPEQLETAKAVTQEVQDK